MVAASHNELPFRNGEVPLSEIWPALRDGHVKVVSANGTESHHVLTLRKAEEYEKEAPVEDVRTLEELMVRGLREVAFERGVSLSQLTDAAHRTGTWLGCSRGPSRWSPLIILAILAASRESRVTATCESGPSIVLSFRRHEDSLARRLDSFEHRLLRLHVEGNSLAEICHNLGTASRATANRLAFMYRKLYVSSRPELLGLVLDFAEAEACYG